MKCNRSIYHKVSNQRICKDIKVDLPYQMCQKSTLANRHKIIWHKSPPQIFKLLKFNSKHQECSKISLNYTPSKQSCRKTAIESGLELLNNLLLGMKVMHPRKFKQELAKMTI